MRLDVRRTLTGNPSFGDTVELKLEDGRTIQLTYRPHASFDHFVWQASESGGIPEELNEAHTNLLVRQRNTVGAEWMMCYAESDLEICEGAPLFLVLVPLGNMHDWPRNQTTTRVELITVS